MPPRPRKRARLTLATNAARPSLLKPSRLISAPRLGQAEHARLRIAGLRQRRHRADLDEAEAHRAEGVDAAAVLVEPRGQADAVGKREAGDRHRVVHARLLDERDQRRVLDRRQRRRASGRARAPGSSPNRKGRASGKGMSGMTGGRFWHRRAYFGGEDPAMAEQRIEKDTFGDIDVAGRSPVGRADRALAAALRHLDREDAARADPRARAGQAQRRGRQPRPRRARRREGRGDRRRRRRGARRQARRRVPARRSGRPARARRPT